MHYDAEALESARVTSHRLRDAVYDLDMLAGTLDYLVYWARSGEVVPPCPPDWYDPDTWEGSIETFKADTTTDFAVALRAVRRCVLRCQAGVPALLTALRTGAAGSHESAHENLWRALARVNEILPGEDLARQIWECEDVWHAGWPDAVGRIMDAAATADLVAPADGVNETIYALAKERARLGGGRTGDRAAMPNLSTREDSPASEVAPVGTEEIRTATPEKPRLEFRGWRFFERRVEYRGLVLDVRPQINETLDSFVIAGEQGLTMADFRETADNQGWKVKKNNDLSSLVKELNDALTAQGWKGFEVRGRWYGKRRRWLVTPDER